MPFLLFSKTLFVGITAVNGIENAFFAGTLNLSKNISATCLPFIISLISSEEIVPPRLFGFSK